MISSVEGQTNFEVKVVFDEHVAQVRPGMTADVDIETGLHAKTLAVPIQSVVIRTQSQLDRAAKGKAGDKKPKKAKGGSGTAAAAAMGDDSVGRKDPEITGVAGLREAGPGDVSFLSAKRYAPLLATTRAAAVLAAEGVEAAIPVVVVKDPEAAITRVAAAFAPPPQRPAPCRSPTARSACCRGGWCTSWPTTTAWWAG